MAKSSFRVTARRVRWSSPWRGSMTSSPCLPSQNRAGLVALVVPAVRADRASSSGGPGGAIRLLAVLVVDAAQVAPGGPGGFGPPPKPLTPEQVGLIRAWVDQGAK